MNLDRTLIYTGESMTLTCDPPGYNLGNDVRFEWKFNGLAISSRRHEISPTRPFKLKVTKVILADAGT